MKSAKRIYSRKKHDSHSPSFISRVNRETMFSTKISNHDPGPGQYQVSLPLVKPKYQAILKKNRSIIIKVNEVTSPGFSSKQPRFKQINTISHQPQPINDIPKNLVNTSSHISQQKHSGRYNFKLARKQSKQSVSNKYLLSQTTHGQNELVHSKIKAPFWSKYKEKRYKWENQTKVPGPGSYDYSYLTPQEIIKKNSWHFRSQTKRAFYQNPQNYKTLNQQQGTDFSLSIHSRKHSNFFK